MSKVEHVEPLGELFEKDEFEDLDDAMGLIIVLYILPPHKMMLEAY